MNLFSKEKKKDLCWCMPQYGWNTAEVGVKHQSSNQSKLISKFCVSFTNLTRYTNFNFLIFTNYLFVIVISVTFSKKNELGEYPLVCKIHHSYQAWPAKSLEILLRTGTRLVFCSRKLMRTGILFSLGPPNPFVISWTLSKEVQFKQASL